MKMRRGFELVAMLVLLANLVLVMLGTVPAIEAQMPWLDALEWAFLLFFLLEYAWRFVCSGPTWRARCRYLLTPLALLDLAALLPSLLTLTALDTTALRVLRLMSLFRILRLLRYQQALDRLRLVFHRTKPDLVVVMMLIAVFMVVTGTLLYMLEREVQPNVFSSIPAALWWAVITVTTIGYGDIVPITPLGKLLSAFCAFAGVVLVAVPTSIIAGAYLEVARLQAQGSTRDQPNHKNDDDQAPQR